MRFLTFLIHFCQKSGKETILEEFEFKGIEEEEEEEGDSLADMERNSAEGDKDKGEARSALPLFDL